MCSVLLQLQGGFSKITPFPESLRRIAALKNAHKEMKPQKLWDSHAHVSHVNEQLMPANVNPKFGLCQERRPHNSIGTMLNSTCGCSKSLWNGKIDAFGRRRFGRHSGK